MGRILGKEIRVSLFRNVSVRCASFGVNCGGSPVLPLELVVEGALNTHYLQKYEDNQKREKIGDKSKEPKKYLIGISQPASAITFKRIIASVLL